MLPPTRRFTLPDGSPSGVTQVRLVTMEILAGRVRHVTVTVPASKRCHVNVTTSDSQVPLPVPLAVKLPAAAGIWYARPSVFVLTL